MSDDINSTHTMTMDAWMRADDVMSVIEEAGESRYVRLPENCFLYAMKKPAMDALLSGKVDTPIAIGLETKKEHLRWSGMGAGEGIDSLLVEKIAPLVYGTIEAIFFWEGGGAIGLRIRDGVATKHKVTYALGDVIR